MPRDSEIIDVRPDEALDSPRLEGWLREHLPAAEGPLHVEQFGGGHANLTYLIAFGETEYVLRRPPLGPVAPSAHDMAREHRVLARLGEGFPLAPTSFALCEDDDVLGAPFHVMERRHGFVIRATVPDAVRSDRAALQRLSAMIVDTLADLHAVDPAAVGLDTLGRPDGFVQRQLDGWARRWDVAKDRDLPAVSELVTWFRARVPPTGRAALLHNDYKLDNLLVDRADPARATAVLDWDMCTRGEPLMDLGYLLNVWLEPGDDPSWREGTAMPSYEPGFYTRAEVVDRYARRTGTDVSDVVWFYAFGVFKLLVILQQIYIRYLRGQTQDDRFASLGGRIATLAEKGLAVTRQGL